MCIQQRQTIENWMAALRTSDKKPCFMHGSP
jgi:hypothetical protein